MLRWTFPSSSLTRRLFSSSASTTTLRMASSRPSSSAPNTNTTSTSTNTQYNHYAASNHRLNFNAIQIQRTRRGGRDVFVRDNRVQEAYNQLRTICKQGNLMELERRSRHYVKPKLQRQQRLARRQKWKEAVDFKTKIDLAMELMREDQQQPQS